MIRIILIATALLALQGCTVAQSAQYATTRYCLLPAEVRAVNREAVALAVAPHRISIQCAGAAHE